MLKILYQTKIAHYLLADGWCENKMKAAAITRDREEYNLLGELTGTMEEREAPIHWIKENKSADIRIGNK